MWCYTGPADAVDAELAPARALGGIALDGVMELPFPVWNSAFDALYPKGYQWYWRADFFNELSDEAIMEFTYITMMYEMHAVISRALRLEWDDRDDPIVEVAAPADYHARDIGADISGKE